MTSKAKYSYDREFQLNILKIFLQDPTLLHTQTQAIKPGYFSFDDLKLVCRNLLKYYYKIHKSPSISEMKALVLDTVSDKDRVRYTNLIESIYNDPLTSDPKFVKEAALRFGGTRALADACIKIVKMLQRGDEELVEARNIIDKALQVGFLHEESLDMHDVLKFDTLRSMISESGLRENRIPTMLPTLNSFSGGLGLKEVGVLIGGPKIGKTTTMVNLGAMAVLSGFPVLHVSLEPKPVDLGCYYASRFTGMTVAEIMTNKIEYEEAMSFLKLGRNMLRVEYYNPGDLDVPKLRILLNHLAVSKEFKPKLMIIDYADRMDKTKDYNSLGDLYDQLSGIANDYKLGIWTGSQVHRNQFRSEIVDVTGVANSWLKIANADMIITLNQTPKEKQRGILRFFVAMARRSKDNYILQCEIDYKSCMVKETGRAYVSVDEIPDRDEKGKSKRE